MHRITQLDFVYTKYIIVLLHDYITGKFNEEDLQKKWQALRDEFRKVSNKENAYVPSGSGNMKSRQPITFAFYNQMSFLKDVFASIHAG